VRNINVMLAEKNFSAKTLAAIKARGLALIGCQFSSYVLDDHGTCRVRTFREVLEIANGAPIEFVETATAKG